MKAFLISLTLGIAVICSAQSPQGRGPTQPPPPQNPPDAKSPNQAVQGHGALHGVGMKSLDFLVADWHGKQVFNTGGAPMVGDIVNHISQAVGGRYIEEKLATTFAGRKPTDSRHFITYDANAKVYRAWWFNDTLVGPMELQGSLMMTGKLVMVSVPTEKPGPVFCATYGRSGANGLVYTFKLKTPTGWRLLFTSTYTK